MGLHGRKFLFNVTLKDRDRYLDSMSLLSPHLRERELFSKDFLASADAAGAVASFQNYFDHAPAKDLLSRLLYLDTKTYLPADVLTKVDRMSMLTSLEVRAPFLDHVFVEWAAQLPVELKFRDGRGKYLLRKLAARVGVPQEILDKPKRGFALPLVHWMRNELKDGLLSILLEPRTLQRGYFNRKAVEALLEEHWRERRDHSSSIWLLLMFELWHRNFLEANFSGQQPPVSSPSLMALGKAN
jgi:asparagine synthase (glutamine-hydrolysing)